MKRVRTVDDVMDHSVVSVGLDARVREIVHVLRRRQVSAVPVLSAEGRVVGVASEADVLQKVPGETRDDGRVPRDPDGRPSDDGTGRHGPSGRGRRKRLPVVDGGGRRRKDHPPRLSPGSTTSTTSTAAGS
ncbi:CBS domain-containing protein [Streptomyces sp. R302]|uniref:CBS domain-containing protein n=1 Tax=unclassified Streptomyces TaxID=2593676 RepID=UPI00145E8AB2|nr:MULTISPECIES: CBS domain-containing protein [unclassified Streptomyces]NML51101.1 CBS domain-containing protein [Streptomyces sp. R301]NML81196.1 CBS domain-containing protein [Streptomyces sp. R302]